MNDSRFHVINTLFHHLGIPPMTDHVNPTLKPFGISLHCITDDTNGHLALAREFAVKTGQVDQLEETLERLHNVAKNCASVCHLYKDFAPYSFGFDIPGAFNGGVIYHGRHDNGGDGGAPTFSVCLTETNGWNIHT